MAEAIVDNNLTLTEGNEISPYNDPSYPIKLFLEGVEENYQKAEEAANSIYKELAKFSPELARIRQETQKDVKYILDLTDEMLADIESGKVKLSVENGGKTYAQIREKKGYGKKVPVKREVFAEDIEPIQVANAMQLKAIQEQVEAMTDQVVAIDLNVKDVLQGQQNDRIGLFQSGLSLYLEALSVEDKILHKQLVSQALRSLSEATFQLALEMDSDIRFLANREYKNGKKTQVSLIDQRMSKINQSFAFVFQSSLLRAAIYLNEGEIPAMAKVLERYSEFINNTVSANAAILIECDRDDKGIESGTWRSRSKLQLDVSGIEKQLCSKDKTIYLVPMKEVAS